MLAFHGIFSAYGFWLPNDPRGSYSSWVASWELSRYAGAATKVSTTRSVAAKAHNRERRIGAKRKLKHAPVAFNGRQARAIGEGFSVAASKSGYAILACAILPDHVHVVVKASTQKPMLVMGHLKREATLRLVAEGMHSFRENYASKTPLPSCWSEGCWKVYLDTPADVVRAIRYVEDNPPKEGKPRQHWACVELAKTRRDKPAG